MIRWLCHMLGQGLARPGLARPGLARPGLARPGLARPGLARRSLSAPIPVEVVASDQGFQLLRGGEPYYVCGAGFGGGSLEDLAAAGANSLRTWSVHDAGSLLDRAQSLGLSVALGLDIGLERHGFDYDDAESVASQCDTLREQVVKYKDHPALLCWIIGNEPNLNYSNPRVFDAINVLSKMIHELDGAHPTTTALAGFDPHLGMQVDLRAPDLDFLSIQLYGGLSQLPQVLRETDFQRPVMVTEWGTTGHWEVQTTAWGAPLEDNSSTKADNFLTRYREVIDTNRDRILGSYAFFWGQKQERTPTWYGMFLADGSATEVVDVMAFLWSGIWPLPRAPGVKGMTLAGQTADHDVILEADKEYCAQLQLNESLQPGFRCRWELMAESTATQVGGDAEDVPATLSGLFVSPESDQVTLRAPAQPGHYRLFAYVYGAGEKAGHANVPFRVVAGESDT